MVVPEMGIRFYWGVLIGLCFRLLTAMAAIAMAIAMAAIMAAYISSGDSEPGVSSPLNRISIVCVLKCVE